MSRRRPPRSKQSRARIALALCVVWIVGFELMPWMHIALHGHLAPHHHDETGAIVLGLDPREARDHHDDDRDAEVDEHGAPIAPHHHDDADDDRDAEVDEHGAPIAAHHHDDADDDRDAEVDEHGAPIAHARHHAADDAQARLASALVHGQHSLAHHGIAVPTPAPVVTSPLPIDRRPITIAAIAAATPCRPVTPIAAARGPPAGSSSQVI